MPSVFNREVAEARAALYGGIRAYFQEQNVLEVEVPLLGVGGSTDLHLASMSVTGGDKSVRYLQTSPEFFMKRLLCEGAGDIFTLCKAFRESEVGVRHNPEFSLLEWYRVGFSLDDLIDDVLSLLRYIGVAVPVNRFSYAEVFQSVTDLDPHKASLTDLSKVAVGAGVIGDLDRAGFLDFIVSALVEPTLPKGLVVLDMFPACQAALAKTDVNDSGDQVAQRFEIYWDGLELANGYAELTDPVEQQRRFNLDEQQRALAGLPEIPWDQKFLKAMEAGMPECSGVALGLDRLLMRILGKQGLSDCLNFSWDRL